SVWNPCFENVTSYVPGGRRASLYRPALSEVDARVPWSAGPRASIETSGSGPPVATLASPMIVPVVCASAVPNDSQATAQIPVVAKRLMVIPHSPASRRPARAYLGPGEA